MRALLLIAWRAAVESLNDRMTRVMNVLFVPIAPVALVGLVVRPLESAGQDLVANALPFYLLVIGFMPSLGAVGIAAGQFAGERERGVLTPLLASPASNVAIFGGKVLGSIMPPLLYALIAEAIYVGGILVVLGVDRLALLPPGLSIGLVLLVPAATCLAAIVAALVSSRVRTYNSAQQIASVLLVPLWAGIFSLAFKLDEWGNVGIFGSVAAIVALDVALTMLAARTWQRQEVLSQK